jgi:hypothetical protein
MMAYRQLWVKEEGEVCGGCRHVKGPGRWAFTALSEAANKGLIPLLRTSETLSKQPFYCTREKCQVHLIDRACSLWEPPDPKMVDPLVMDRFQDLAKREGLHLVEAMERLMSSALEQGSIVGPRK